MQYSRPAIGLFGPGSESSSRKENDAWGSHHLGVRVSRNRGCCNLHGRHVLFAAWAAVTIEVACLVQKCDGRGQ